MLLMTQKERPYTSYGEGWELEGKRGIARDLGTQQISGVIGYPIEPRPAKFNDKRGTHHWTDNSRRKERSHSGSVDAIRPLESVAGHVGRK